MSYFFDLTRISDIDRLEIDWIMLEQSSNCSYFQSWGWIGTWLKEVAADLEPEVLRVWDRHELVAIGILVKVTVRRAGFLVSRKLFLNEAPESNRNMVIEYNGMLVRQDHEESVYKDVVFYLCYSSTDWDELYLGMIRKEIADKFVDQFDSEFVLSIDRQTKSWQFDSENITPSVDGVLATLSRNRRNQIKRAFRAYEAHGKVRITEAKTLDQALKFFADLENYHTQRWVAKGKTGSFNNQLWKGFHRSLISRRFSNGEIQLLRVSTEKEAIGYIYSFTWRGRVYVLQTGFNIAAPKHGQPGYVSHIKAIIFNKSKNNNIYDLLSEDSGYKSIICNQSEEMVSVSFKRIAVKSMLRQLSFSNIKSGYAAKVIKGSIQDKMYVYGSGTIDYLRERWVRAINRWPCKDKKYLLVGSESSGTTAISELLFKEVNNLRYLEEGEHQWVWNAYRKIYQKEAEVRDYPRLQLFDAIKVPGFSVIINEFLKEFPNTKVVYLVRDPRDFASSAIKTWKIRSMDEFDKVPWSKNDWLGVDCLDPVACLAHRWKTYINAASKVKGVIFIKYEDFCQDKVGVIANICKKLELPFDIERVTMLCDRQLSHGSVRAYRPSGPGGWKHSILERKHIETIESICKDEMLEWGYTSHSC
jgi:hypothetical protein